MNKRRREIISRKRYATSSKANCELRNRGGRRRAKGSKRREASLDTPGNKTFRLDVTSAVYNIAAKRRESASRGEHERAAIEGGYEENEERMRIGER